MLNLAPNTTTYPIIHLGTRSPGLEKGGSKCQIHHDDEMAVLMLPCASIEEGLRKRDSFSKIHNFHQVNKPATISTRSQGSREA